MMNSLSWANSDDSKDLCTDFKSDKLETFYTHTQCLSLWDYKAKILATLPRENNPAVYVGSGVVAYNLLLSKAFDRQKENTDSQDFDAEKLGFKIYGKFHFPYGIVYSEGGTKTDNDTLSLNMLDKKIVKRHELYVIAREDGKKPTKQEILKYKQKIRKQIIQAKKSGKYDDFEGVPGF